MPVKHSTTLTGTDDPGYDVSKDEWNADHLAMPCVITLAAHNDQVWTDQPAALTEMPTVPNTRTKADLTNCTEARMVLALRVAGASTSEMRVQYSTDQSSWNYLDSGTGPAVVIDTGAGTARASSWVTLVSGAKADVWLRVVGINGNATVDPRFGNIQLQVR